MSAEPRQVRPRRNAISGRAVAGGFLVAAAAVGLFAAFARESRSAAANYVVAARDLRVGQRLGDGDLATVAIRLPDTQRQRAYDDPAVLFGATVVSPVGAGELIQASDVARSGAHPAEVVLSVPVPRARALPGDLAAGQRVDVYVTYGTYTAVVARGIEVLRVSDGNDGLRALTVAAGSTSEALALTHAAVAGEVSVALSPEERPPNESTRYETPQGG